MRALYFLFALLLVAVPAGCGQKAGKPTEGRQETQPQTGETEAASLPKLWDFSAEWCPPCREQKPIIHALETEYSGKVEFRIIDVDQEKELASKFGVQAIPTQVFLDSDGNELSRHVGLLSRDSIIARFRAHGFIQ